MNKRIIALICVLIAFLNTSDIKARVIRESLGEVTISAYSPYCNTPAGTRNTATGKRATARHTIAVDANNPIVPVGSKVEIDGIIYTVEDRGGFGKYGRDFDIFMDTDEEADRWGVRRRIAYLIRPETRAEKQQRLEALRDALEEQKIAKKYALKGFKKYKVIYCPYLYSDTALIHQKGDYNHMRFTGIIGNKFYQIHTSPLIPEGSILISTSCNYLKMKLINSEG